LRIRWIHTADVHLGYQQYGRKERSRDFTLAFKHVCEQAIRSRVDFLLIAGDLFHKRNVDPFTVNQAWELLERLRAARIPVLCVEGNHERAFYGGGFTWLDFLSNIGLLHLLAPTYEGGVSSLEPWDEDARLGGYVDIGPARVLGIKYHGASAPAVLKHVSEGLATRGDRPFSVMMLHEGLEGQLPRATGGLSSTQMEVLRPHCDYLALGHIHKQYDFGRWAFNPGSLETCSSEEADWERGYYEVTADTEARALVDIRLQPVPRRPFRRFYVDAQGFPTPGGLEDAVMRQVERGLAGDGGARPVLEVTLRGTLPFSDDALRLRELEERVQEAFDPLVVRIKNHTVPAGFHSGVAVGEDGQIDRRALELQVFQELVARDSRYAFSASELARMFQQLKDLALEGRPPEDAVALLERDLPRPEPAEREGDAA
jgi:DNA repair exonuclease SbcCD nuclease subunit